MTIYNLGSINIDNVFEMDWMPSKGETLTANRFSRGLGGKGANQSVAVARAGGQVRHIGAVGDDGGWMLEAIRAFNVDVSNVRILPDESSGQAIIYVDADAENSIVLHAGTNRQIEFELVEAALADAGSGDCLILQNETNLAVEAAKLAKQKGMIVAYSAAPFEAAAVEELLEYLDILAVNEIEMQQLQISLPHRQTDIEKLDLLVTKGSQGASFTIASLEHAEFSVPAFAVDALDTTGAGDTFFGFFIHALMSKNTPNDAMKIAAAAAALQVTKIGASSAIPSIGEVNQFLSEKVST